MAVSRSGCTPAPMKGSERSPFETRPTKSTWLAVSFTCGWARSHASTAVAPSTPFCSGRSSSPAR
jgi:hypothetical protein